MLETMGETKVREDKDDEIERPGLLSYAVLLFLLVYCLFQPKWMEPIMLWLAAG